MTTTLRKLHRISALLIAAYACIHIINHLVGLGGIEAHIAFMRAARSVYRLPVVETVLLIAIAFQICSGLTLLIRGWKQRSGFIPWLQAGSGAYLAFFFLLHVSSVINIRTTFHLDTNFYVAAAGFYVPPLQFFFMPYYFLAVVALFTHVGCALYWRFQAHSRPARTLAVALPVGIGFAVSLLIVLMLAGAFYPVHVPSEYKAPFGQHP
jgi:succinate dehydrogenase/fumarate reductase cytochrome b subunit